jgi:hypothetical protein
LHPYGQVPLQNPLQGSGDDDEGGLTGAVVTFAGLVGAFVTGGGTTVVMIATNAKPIVVEL